jgi:hypothetical protein
MLGQLTLEGKLVPRDIQEAVNLIDRAGTYDFNARMQVVRLLAEIRKRGSAIPSARSTMPLKPRNSTNPARRPP